MPQRSRNAPQPNPARVADIPFAPLAAPLPFLAPALAFPDRTYYAVVGLLTAVAASVGILPASAATIAAPPPVTATVAIGESNESIAIGSSQNETISIS